MDIDILLPTRERPNRLRELFDSLVKNTIKINKIKVYLYIDDDDEKTLSELSKIKNEFPTLSINEIIGPRITISKAWNKCWEISSGEIVMICADDVRFESIGWDRWVENTFLLSSDKIQLVFCNDGFVPHERWFGTHPFVSRFSTNILGRVCPPYFKCDYNDLWLDEIYQSLCRKIYLPHVLIKHYHHISNPKYKDKTETEMRAHKEEAAKIWEDTKEERNKDMQKLYTYIISKKG